MHNQAAVTQQKSCSSIAMDNGVKVLVVLLVTSVYLLQVRSPQKLLVFVTRCLQWQNQTQTGRACPLCKHGSTNGTEECSVSLGVCRGVCIARKARVFPPFGKSSASPLVPTNVLFLLMSSANLKIGVWSHRKGITLPPWSEINLDTVWIYENH